MDHDKLEALNAVEGYVPVRILPDPEQIVWQNLGSYHAHEGRFADSLKIARALLAKSHGSDPQPDIATGYEALCDTAIPDRHPDVLIFHMSRCGSTLLTRALAQSRRNNVFGEPGLLFPLKFASLRNGWSDAKFAQRVKELFSALGRQRVAEHEHFIVKLSSSELFFQPLLSALFPDARQIFLYRNPIEVAASLLAKPPAWLKARFNPWQELDFEDTKAAGFEKDGAHESVRDILQTMLESALAAPDQKLRFLNYNQLTADRFSSLLDRLKVKVPEADLGKMSRQFGIYSKSGLGETRFVSDSEDKRRSISPEIRAFYAETLAPLYEALEQSDSNLAGR